MPMPSFSLHGDGAPGPVPALAPTRVLPRLGPGPTVLVVGYPAPAAVEIVDRLLATDPRTVAAVVAPGRWDHATRAHRAAQDAGRLRLFKGSPDVPGLGLAHTAWRLLDTADEIYGVASAQEIGTGHLHDFAAECPHVRELHLVESDVGTPAPGGVRATLGRVLGSVRVPAPVRTSAAGLTSVLARAVAAIGRVGPVARAVRPWKDVLALDIDAALSWEDIEQDLWPRKAT